MKEIPTLEELDYTFEISELGDLQYSVEEFQSELEY